MSDLNGPESIVPGYDFERILQESPSGIMLMHLEEGDNLKPTMYNSAFTEMVGYSQEELIGMNLLNLVHPDDLPDSLGRLTRLRSGEESSTDSEFRIIRKSGEIVWVRTLTYTVPNAAGKPEYLCSHLQDITRMKEEHEAKERAEVLQRTIMLAAGTIAHDQKNFFTGMRATIRMMQIMSEKGMLDRAMELVSRLELSIDAGIDQLTEFEKIEALAEGAVELHKEKVPVRDIDHEIDEFSLVFHAAAKQSGLDMRYESFVVDSDARVDVDSIRIKNVISNLISNAIKYTDQGEVVLRSSIDDSDNSFCLEIEDTGIGIPDEEIDKIWEFSYRASNVGSKKGLGFGAAICKIIVELHGGRINVRSELGKGTIFQIKLPLVV
jgi:PAS domain S-box-containing protein